MIVSFDPIEMQTSERIAAVRSLLHLLKEIEPKCNPAYLERKQLELRKHAQEHDLEAEEYFAEREILDDQLKFRLPQFTAFAIVPLLYTILEVHLRECAKRVEERMNLCFSLDDIGGRGIDKYAKYLSKPGVCKVKDDGAWPALKDLQAIRNLIVHRAGTDIEEKDAKRLKQEYKEKFDYLDHTSGWWKEVRVSADLCQLFADKVEALTKRCFSDVKSAVRRDEC